MTLLYIDPGTGSALFSIMIALASTIYFVAKYSWIRIKTMFSRGRISDGATAKPRERLVIYSEGKRYWNTFLPIVDELERRGVDAVFMTSEEDDPIFGQERKHIRPLFIGKGNLAYARLNMLEADICLMTTPGLDVYQLKRSKHVRHYAHILHAVDDATSYRLFGLDYFDSILLSGDYQESAIRELEAKRNLPAKQLRVVGSTYLDVYASHLKTLPPLSPGNEAILVSPSWGDSGLLKRYGTTLLLPLAESGMKIIIRPHPQSALSEATLLEDLKTVLMPYPSVEWDSARENIPALARASVMISDFSGIIFDYAFLFGRPVLYAKQNFDVRPYDASDVSGPAWKFETLGKIGKEITPEDFPRMAELVESIKADASVGAAIDVARNEAWQFRGESGVRATDFLLEHLN